MTKPTSQETGTLRLPLGSRKAMTGLLLATMLMAMTGARADVFGGGGNGGAAQQAAQQALLDRLAVMEKELAALKANGVTAPPVPGAPKADKAVGSPQTQLKMPAPPPGLEGLPSGGQSERERLIVEKEMSFDVLGTVNGKQLVRDGENRFLFTKAEFEAFKKAKREKVVNRMKMDAATEADGGKVSFPTLMPPPPEPVGAVLDAAGQVVTQAAQSFSQAGQVVSQARAIEANGGQIPKPPTAAAPSAAAPGKPAAAAAKPIPAAGAHPTPVKVPTTPAATAPAKKN